MTFLSSYLIPWLVVGLLLALAFIFWGRFHRNRTIAKLSSATSGNACRLSSCASPMRRRILVMALLIATFAIAFALLRPSTGTQLTEHRLPAKDIVILMDVSKSMGVKDSNGLSRMEMAKLWAKEFIAKRPTDRIGLVTFSGISFPECPATRDRSVLIKRIDFQTAGVLSVGGTDLEGALEQARKFLGEDPSRGSSIILLSDGDNVTGDPAKATESFTAENIPVHTVAFGNPSVAGSLPQKFGSKGKKAVQSKANPALLQNLSEATSGAHIAIGKSGIDSSMNVIHNAVDAIEVDGKNITTEIFSRPIDIYQYPLTLAVIMILIRMFLPIRTRSWHPITPAIAALLVIGAVAAPAAHAEEKTAPADQHEFKSFTNYKEALTAAKAQNKPLLILFTGSDWSKTSITFDREIYRHSVFKNWINHKAILLHADLPRKTIDEKLRSQNRSLADKYSIKSYPITVFIDTEEKELGRLGHDRDGPSSWVERANKLLLGDKSAGDSAKSITQLPNKILNNLEEDTINDAEKSMRYFHLALKTEKEDPELALSSSDRFELITDLLNNAVSYAGDKHPKLAFPALHKLGVIYHMRGRSMLEKEELKDKKPEDALSFYQDTLTFYTSAAALEPAHKELTGNLSLVLQDIQDAKDLIAFNEAYKLAVENTGKALILEENMHTELQRWVTTSREVNDQKIRKSTESIDDLIYRAATINHKEIGNFRKASESIRRCPSPHTVRQLNNSEDIIQETLDYLVPPEEQQRQQQPGGG